MHLIIDPTGGIAGDMFTAALVSAGADFQILKTAMLAAAGKLGSAEITLKETSDGANQLDIELDSKSDHLGGNHAKRILEEIFSEFGVEEAHRRFGFQVLDILLAAETKAHTYFKIEVQGHHHHHHGEEALLHEAQDIVIDITGAVMGLKLLGVEPGTRLSAPLNVGGGWVEFSHGRLPVPAPATGVVLDSHDIEWQKGPLDVELATPTGVSILAALGAGRAEPGVLEEHKIINSGTSRGSKILDIPPLKVFLVQ